MRKIYLFCSAGMSTSLLASSMQMEADIRDLPITVEAFPINQMGDIIKYDRPDCILLGPQSKHLYKEMLDQFGHEGIPMAVIDSEAYGMMNGNKVLAMAIKLIQQKSNKKEES